MPAIPNRRTVLGAIFTAVALASISSAQQLVSFPTLDGGIVYADLYGKGDRAVVLAHGGGRPPFNKASWEKQARILEQAGFRVLAIDFRGRGQSRGGTLLPAGDDGYHFDVLAAVRYLRANAAKLGIDPDKIGTMGGSAGGHLTLFLGVTGNVPEFEGDGPNKDQSSKVQAVVSFYGPSDFTKSYGRSVDAAEVLPLFLGGDLEHAREMHLRASPLNWVTPDAAPTMAIQGTKDRYVNYEQSVWIIDRLLAVGVPAELETIPGADHGFKGADEERAEVRMIEWFKRWLK